MTNSEDKTFHCDLIDPTGKLLACQATSVVLPAHDGQLGILCDHMPMLCQLGLGVMKVTPAPADSYQGTTPARGGEANQGDLFFFIDGGSALVAQNTVTVIAYDALALQDVKVEQIQSMIDKTAKNAASPSLPAIERIHENERLRALQKLAESRKSQ
ncbi:MAG: F0F1 ATP synthase subunit epsilon [Phycisphaerae bacterium]|nr:F0F1 ATP synthase subunit epsilon [Phycisphaerae bacterium]